METFRKIQHDIDAKEPSDSWNGDIILQTLRSDKVALFFAAFMAICAWSLASLACFHGLIITVSETTNERVRSVYDSIVNPADRGIMRNWFSALCSPIPESRIPKDFSEIVDCCEARKARDLDHASAVRHIHGDDAVAEASTLTGNEEFLYNSLMAAEVVSEAVTAKGGIYYTE
jgi:hypothetical protein